MSELNDVLDRAQTDFDFYLALQADSDSALAPYGLTRAEREVLRDPAALWRLISAPAAQSAGEAFGVEPPAQVLPVPDGPIGVPDGPAEPIDGPVEGPPAEGPPAEGPPLEGPPLEGPPLEGPPLEGPPLEGPPLEGPPLEGPPLEGPPLEGPPLEGPPLEGPPLEGPPIGITPITPIGPPIEGPPVGIIPVTPIEGPPLEGPPLEGPPVSGVGIHGPGGISVGVSPVVGDPVSPGIVGVIPFLSNPDVTGLPEPTQLQGILANPAVVSAVQGIRTAADEQARLEAVNDLMRELG
jgi:hypothetical protein